MKQLIMLFLAHFMVVVLSSCAATPATSERIELPSTPVGLKDQNIHSEPNTLAGSLISFASFVAMTAASGGMVTFIPLPRPKDAKVLFQLTTPGQAPDNAEELFTISLHEGSGDTEDKATIDLITTLNKWGKRCTNYFSQNVIVKNEVTLIQFESLNCIRPGYLYSLSRFLKGEDGVYQIVYTSRKKAPEGIDFELWIERLSQARVVKE